MFEDDGDDEISDATEETIANVYNRVIDFKKFVKYMNTFQN